MNLEEKGKLLCELRKSKGMTQKDVAEKLGVLPKTVSKWETGHGFPDVSMISGLADVLGVSERMLLSGDITKNNAEIGNVRKTKFYVCPTCGSVMNGTGECQLICCGKVIEALKPKEADEEHKMSVSKVEDDLYIEFNHPMKKEHYVSFVAHIGFDRILMIRLYPEQDAVVRFPLTQRGKLYYYCSEHGLFEYKI